MDLFSASFAPVIVVIFYVYIKDKFEKELYLVKQEAELSKVL